MQKENLLEIKNLSVSIKKQQILNQVNLSVHRGETLALVGSSGSGKTLTALSILQLLPDKTYIQKDSEILLAGKSLLNCSPTEIRKIRGKQIGMIFQEANLAFSPVLTIGEQIASVLKYHSSLNLSDRKKRVLDLLDKTGIIDPEHCVKSYPHMLSGGMRQRAMIAMALAAEPDLLIADEPTTALDVTLQAQILDLLLNIQKIQNIGLLFITHDLAIAKHIAHQVAIISEGKIVESNTVDNFFNHPTHEYSQKLLAAFPAWEKRKQTQLSSVPLLKVENLKIVFDYGQKWFMRKANPIKAVNNVSFSLGQGETLALVGESGSGKTTTAKSIVGLIHPNAGNLYFEGEALNKISSKHRRNLDRQIQMIFQDPATSMDPRMRVGEILLEGAIAQKIFKSKHLAYQSIDEWLHNVGLPTECKHRYPHEFSGGQRQRICIARALIMQPKLIICDEPTSALDVITQMDILNLLKSLQKKLKISYLFITHNMSVVAYLADKVAVMHQGEIVEQGNVENILFHPQHDYTKQLLSAVPKI